ncbi:MAG: hypothetical protein ACOCXH_13680 [Cyclobacteriaceae bacterium]
MNVHELNPANVTLQLSPDDFRESIEKAAALGAIKALEQYSANQQAPAIDPERLYTISDLMKRFEVSRITIWQWEKKNLLQSTRIGNLKRFAEKDIQAFLKLYNPR